MHKKGGPLGWVASALVIIGGVNWGLVGVGMLVDSNLNLVNLLFGSIPTLEAIIYLLVGVSALWMALACCGGKCEM